MSDIGPNVPLELKRLRVDISQAEVNLDKIDLSIMELEDTIARHHKNKEATRESIEEMRHNLGRMVEEHGGEES